MSSDAFLSQATYINCTVDVTVLWVNKPPKINVGSALDVNEDAVLTTQVSTAPVTATDPDPTQVY